MSKSVSEQKRKYKKCFGIGNDNEKECEKCKDYDDCLEEAEARSEHYYMVG